LPKFSTCDVNDCIGLLYNKYEKRAVLPESHRPTSSTSLVVLRLFLHKMNNTTKNGNFQTLVVTRFSKLTDGDEKNKNSNYQLFGENRIVARGFGQVQRHG